MHILPALKSASGDDEREQGLDDGDALLVEDGLGLDLDVTIRANNVG